MSNRRHLSLSFFAIAFGYSWVIWGIMWILYREHVASFKIAAMFGPALACIVVRKVIAREGFGDAGLRPGRVRFYPLAWLWAPFVAGLALVGTVALGHGSFAFNAHPAVTGTEALRVPAEFGSGTRALGQVVLNLTVNALILLPIILGEDFGWHGYVVPKLQQRFGQLRTALVFGGIWAAWHVPVVLMGHNNPSRTLGGAAVALFFISVMGVCFAWFRIMSKSLWVPALAHGAANASPGLAFYLSRGMSAAVYISMVMVIFLLAAIGTGIHLWRRDREKTVSVI